VTTPVVDPAKRAPMLHLRHPEHHVPGYEMPDSASPPLKKWQLLLGFLIAVALAFTAYFLHHASEGMTAPDVPLPWVLPFALLLAGIATMPFIAKHFWEHHYHHISMVLGAIVAGYYIFALSAGKNIAASMSEYISFIFLLGSLFIVSGGILIRVRKRSTPLVNTSILLIGAVIANLFGTTGAAMLLIRPYLRINKGNIKPYHIVFFIFSVANIGGALTPIGDPPLFLGFIKGVPFWWVMDHCLPIWLTALGIVLAIFFVVDTIYARKNAKPAEASDADDLGPAISIYGGANIIFIALVLAAVFIDPPYREILMAVAAFGSLATTPRRVHGENSFNYAPIKEVAFLFIGIFATMVPALNYLNKHASDEAFQKYLATPGQFFFASGSLSAVLDNAPTYLTFLEVELGKFDNKDDRPVIEHERAVIARRSLELTPDDLKDLTPEQTERLKALHAALVRYHGSDILAGKVPATEVALGMLLDDTGKLVETRHTPAFPYYQILMAISMGAVFFGACTYIGNGPNFMVKSIAEHNGVACPSFFGYILYYTIPVLLPTFILVWFIFLRI